MTAGGDEARGQVLAAIRRALGRGALDERARAALEARLNGHPRGPVPARGKLPHGEQVELFRRMAEEAAATVEHLPDVAAVPKATADYLQANNLPAELRLAPDPGLAELDWAGAAPLLAVSQGPAEDATAASLTRAFAGIAETGTLMLASGRHGPTSLNFLPATHIVVLDGGAIVGPYEDAWERLRAACGESGLPRTVNLITGPSRTGDIEQTIQLGAHGPQRLHILVVGDGG